MKWLKKMISSTMNLVLYTTMIIALSGVAGVSVKAQAGKAPTDCPVSRITWYHPRSGLKIAAF